MPETVRKPIEAKTLCAEIIAIMQEDPANHDLWRTLLGETDKSWITFPGKTNGGPELALETLKKLGEIHIPNCSLHQSS